MKKIDALSSWINSEIKKSQSNAKIILPIIIAIYFSDKCGRIFFRKPNGRDVQNEDSYYSMDLSSINVEYDKWQNRQANSYLDSRYIFQKSGDDNIPLDTISYALYFELRILLNLPRINSEQTIIRILRSHFIKSGKIKGNVEAAKALLASYNIAD